MNTIRLVNLATVAPEIVTAYGSNGKTRDASGRTLPRTACVIVGDDKRLAKLWRCSPATASALRDLNADCVTEGCDFRLLALFRDPVVQAEERTKYDAWVAAGRPDPDSVAFNRTRMRTVYVSRPGFSFHGCALAFDLDISSLSFADGTKGNAALARFWGIAAKHGFAPVISRPLASMNESWHFDRLGVFEKVRAFLDAHPSTRGDDYGYTAVVASALMGTHPKTASHPWLYIQARLIAGGFHPGVPDGALGKLTREALKAAGAPHEGPLDPVGLIGDLDKLGVGLDLIRDA